MLQLLILSCVLIDQMSPFDRDAPDGTGQRSQNYSSSRMGSRPGPRTPTARASGRAAFAQRRRRRVGCNRRKAVTLINILAELCETLGRSPGCNIHPVHGTWVASLASTRSPDRIASSIWCDPNGCVLEQPGHIVATFWTRMQPEDTNRSSSPKIPFSGVSCI